MKPFVREAIDGVRFIGNGIHIIIKKFIHHEDRSVGNIGRPFINVVEKSLNDLLGAEYSFHILVRLGKKTMQPLFTTGGTGKVEFVKNREFFFRVKDRYILECRFVYVHSES